MISLGTLALVAIGSGVAGWGLERVLTGAPRYSPAFSGAHVPFLPVYALGGLALFALEPVVQGYGWPARALAYGAALTAVEAGAGFLDRATGHRTWDYQGRVIDLPHAAAWAALGLAAEPIGRMMRK